jgi:hypothetical protein
VSQRAFAGRGLRVTVVLVTHRKGVVAVGDKGMLASRCGMQPLVAGLSLWGLR